MKAGNSQLASQKVLPKKKYSLFYIMRIGQVITDNLKLKSHFYRSEFFSNAFSNCKQTEPYKYLSTNFDYKR